MSQIVALLGFVFLLASFAFNAIQGTQIAVIGVGFILLGIYLKAPVHAPLQEKPSGGSASAPFNNRRSSSKLGSFAPPSDADKTDK